MRRGEVWLVQLDPIRGSEADKTRPAIIMSNDAANSTSQKLGRGVVTVVPFTTNTTRVYSFQVLMPVGMAGLEADSKAQAEQVRALDVSRLVSRLGVVPPPVLGRVERALRLHLGL